MSESEQETPEATEAPLSRTAVEMGERLKELAEREQEAAEAPEQTPDEKAGDAPAAAPPADDWPFCPVCHGNGRVPPELAHSKTAETCPDCNGLGNVRTGSLVVEAAVLQCDRCMGNGYIAVPRPPEPTQEQPQGWENRY